ncbi:MAG: single-stranded-DNA-specific exonuclease RecJ [Deltaproteobacteria bacterium]|nr:single-stranded-DNA-specific exonuclease RecJ [Deltaproteobacteria bacterium]
MQKRWTVRPPDGELQSLFEKELNISHLTAQLLINRGLRCSSEAFSFLSPSLKNLHDPFKMKGMDKAAARIATAIREREKITIYGDYDVDGTTATALLYLFLKEVSVFGEKETVSYYIPERLKQGYGLNNQSLKQLADSGTKLVITTDCGITNYEEIVFANSIGLDVIITDHHEPTAQLPPAYAILNPKQRDCTFPFKELAGVGVAFNLIIALRAKLLGCGVFGEGETKPNLKKYTDIVALGTIADMVPLIDENRILVKYGLDELTLGRRAGIRALKEVSRLTSDSSSQGIVKAGSVGFQLAPRINAAGRLDSAGKGVRLLITDDEKEAMDIARELDRGNIERQRLERDILSEAVEIIQDSQFKIQEKKAIVLAREGWHPGVIGIVASRLIDRYHRPTVVISLKDGAGKGSARGINKFHILDALKECEGFLEKYGGHKMAAGLTISGKNIQPFEAAFYNLASKNLNVEDLMPEVTLDSYVSLAELNEKIIQEMELLAPFGLANPEPLFGAKDTNIVQSKVVGNNHLKLKIRQEMKDWRVEEEGGRQLPSPSNLKPLTSWDGIAYGKGDIHPLQGNNFDIAFIPYIDEWNGARNLRLKVKEINKA